MFPFGLATSAIKLIWWGQRHRHTHRVNIRGDNVTFRFELINWIHPFGSLSPRLLCQCLLTSIRDRLHRHKSVQLINFLINDVQANYVQRWREKGEWYLQNVCHLKTFWRSAQQDGRGERENRLNEFGHAQRVENNREKGKYRKWQSEGTHAKAMHWD